MKNTWTQIAFLASSLILNSFLLIYLFGLVPFSLFISIVLNAFGGYYIYFLINDRKNFQDEFDSLLNKNEIFLSHLEQVYELEMFYGDETLESLIDHAKKLVKDFYSYENQNFIFEQQEETYDGNETEIQKEEST
mgnify:CR=1 FL=1